MLSPQRLLRRSVSCASRACCRLRVICRLRGRSRDDRGFLGHPPAVAAFSFLPASEAASEAASAALAAAAASALARAHRPLLVGWYSAWAKLTSALKVGKYEHLPRRGLSATAPATVRLNVCTGP